MTKFGLVPNGATLPTEGIPAMSTVGELYEKIAKISQTSACQIKDDYHDVFDLLLMDWDIQDGRVWCLCSESPTFEQLIKPTIAESMYMHDLTYRQAYIHALSEQGYTQTEISEHLGILRSSVSKTMRIIRLKIEDWGDWYEY